MNVCGQAIVATNDPTEEMLVIRDVFTEYAINLVIKLSVRLYPVRLFDKRKTSEIAMAVSANTPSTLTARTILKSVASCRKVLKWTILPKSYIVKMKTPRESV